MAHIFGVSLPFFDRDIRPLVGHKHIKTSGRRLLFYARAAIDAWHEAKLQRRGTPDALLTGSDSPALERYRQERAQLARLDRLERERELLPQADVRAGFTIIANLLRSAGDSLQQQFGQDAHAILEDAWSEATREFSVRFGPDADDNGQSGTGDDSSRANVARGAGEIPATSDHA